MLTFIKRACSLLLSLALVFSVGVGAALRPDGTRAQTRLSAQSEQAVFSAGREEARPQQSEAQESGGGREGILTDCAGNCGHCPTIIVPGIGQSDTFLYDGDEIALDSNGEEITGWPLYVNTQDIVASLLAPLLKMLVTQRDDGFSEKFGQTVREVFYVNQMDENGKNIYDVRVEKYPYSLAMCSQEEKNHIYGCIPIEDYANLAGEDHLYYFAYNSFGNNLEITRELRDFIDMVRRQTGHDKVNLVPISLGGTFANSLFELYPEVHGMLKRVIYIIPALDGTNLVGDLYMGRLNTADEMLYSELFPSLVQGYPGYLINILIRIIPKQVLLDTLDEALEALTDVLLLNCTTMWSLVPRDYFDAAAQRLLSGEEHSRIRSQVEEYHRAQVNSHKNILALKAAGVEVFNIVDYDYPLYKIVPSHDISNADGIIHLESTSMGAYAAVCGQTLGEGYVQKNTYCSTPGHNHISPDNVVDASAGLLPDHTFYFDNQAHEGTAGNDVIMKLSTQLLINEDFKDVYSMPERFPQFNVGRKTKTLRLSMIPQAESLPRDGMSQEDAAELDAALADCYAMLDNTVVDYQQFVDAQNRLEAILVKLGVREKDSGLKLAAEKVGLALTKLISDALYNYWGPVGFSDRLREFIPVTTGRDKRLAFESGG